MDANLRPPARAAPPTTPRRQKTTLWVCLPFSLSLAPLWDAATRPYCRTTSCTQSHREEVITVAPDKREERVAARVKAQARKSENDRIQRQLESGVSPMDIEVR